MRVGFTLVELLVVITIIGILIALLLPAVHLLDLDLGSNEANFKAWAWTDQNGHLSSKAYLELTDRLLAVLQLSPAL